MRKITLPAMLAVLICIVCCTACRKQVHHDEQRTATRETVFPRNAQEQFTVDKIKRTGQIVKAIYRDPAVRREVNAAILSKYYTDETVPLADLLEPGSSPLFRSDAFKALDIPFGHFRSRFIGQIGSKQAGIDQKSYTDSLQEYFMKGGLTIYFPYSDHFTQEQMETTGLSVFIADRDADEAPGEKELLDIGGQVSGHEPVIGNDAYSEVNPCHIVGVNCVVSPSTNIGFYDSVPVPMPPPGRPMAITQVYVGWASSNKTHDAWISFSGNGGGDEMMFCRTSGYLVTNGSQVITFQNVQKVDFTRSDCKNGSWRRVYSVWDPNWNVNNYEQTLSVYEDDTEGTKTISGKLSTTVTFTAGGVSVGPGEISYSHTVSTKDNIFYQQEWERDTYIITSASYDPLVWQTRMRPILIPRRRPFTTPPPPEPGVWTAQNILLFWYCSLQSAIWRTDGKYWPLHTNDNSNPDFMLMWPHYTM